MKKQLYGISLAALLLLGGCASDELPAPSAPQPGTTEQNEPVAGEVLVKFQSYVSDILDRTVVRTRSGAPATRSGILSVDEVLDLVGGYEIERIFPVDARTEERTREAGLNLWYVVRFDKQKSSVEEVIARLSQLGEVQYANPNRKIQRAYANERKATPLTRETLEMMQRRTAATRAASFSDPLLPMQWDLVNDGSMFTGTEACPQAKSVAGADVRCQEAWASSTGDPSIIVAVLDEGVCLTHPELAANIWTNEDEIDGSKRDNDGNGYAGDIHGYNFVTDCCVITWDDLNDTGHSTHVAGVIAAVNGNGEGICSIAGGTPTNPGVKIMSCQIFAGNTGGNSMSAVKAIKYAADNGAVILQCSWGYTSGTANSYEWGTPGYATEEEWESLAPLEKDAIDYFTHNAGSPNGPIDGGIAIFASGNEYANSAGFPGAASMCVSVSATAADYTPATYTNYGPGTNIAAPGGDRDYYWDYGEGAKRGETGCVLSTLPYNVSETGYGYMEGTSMACPHVSGVVALGLSYAAQMRRHFTAEEFRELLYSTATPIDTYITGTKFYYRYAYDMGLTNPTQMMLTNYTGQMGTGQVNAKQLLDAIAGSGVQMQFPNLYVALDGTATERPATYFLNGEQLTYTVQIDDESIATATLENGLLTVKGLKEGSTRASITGGSQTQTFNITVRKSANGNGWL